MGEIRIVGPGKTRRYPYPVCKKEFYCQWPIGDSNIQISVKKHSKHLWDCFNGC